ncbi:hypothetical protein NM22_15770 [Vibrio tubiashii]|nr:hypothetical protein NM22_15770 [Vibrio tubiashii]
MKTFSIVIPVYQNELNLRKTIPTLLNLGQEVLKRYSINTKLIFVDDGSTDRSYEILCDFQSKHKDKMDIVKMSRNFGQTPAIQAGLFHSSTDCTGIISADLQDPPELFFNMLENWIKGEKYVIAERESRLESNTHRFVSGLYWKMIAKYSMKGFPEGGYDFCLLDRQLVKLVSETQEKNTSIFPLLYWFGFHPKVIKYQRRLRDDGKSTWTFVKKIRFTLDTIIGFTYIPTRIITYSAIGTSICAFFYSVFVLSVWLFGNGNTPDGWTTLALLILIIGGVVLFGLGVVCEYLLRILDETRKRPNYVIEETKVD